MAEQLWLGRLLLTPADDPLTAAEHGVQIVAPPYPEGHLWMAATIRDPAGNVIGIWQAGPR
jgi:predicted enzyme related to lactoylglutathione lyase